MENKKDELKVGDLASGFSNYNNDNSWLIGMVLLDALFSNKGWGFQKTDKNNDTESRLSKLEAKTEMLEKIILK